MKIKSIIVVDESGQEFAFTSRSVVEVKPYDPATDPEVQGKGLEDVKEPEDAQERAVTEPVVEAPKSKKGK